MQNYVRFVRLVFGSMSFEFILVILSQNLPHNEALLIPTPSDFLLIVSLSHTHHRCSLKKVQDYNFRPSWLIRNHNCACLQINVIKASRASTCISCLHLCVASAVAVSEEVVWAAKRISNCTYDAPTANHTHHYSRQNGWEWDSGVSDGRGWTLAETKL